MKSNDSEYTLKPWQVKKIINATDRFRDRLIIKLLAYTGLRRFEVGKIRIEEINLEEATLRVVGKGKKLRVVPLISDLVGDLKHFMGEKRVGYLLSEKANPLSNATLHRIVARAGQKAGVQNPNPKKKGINPHVFRHSLARSLKDKNISLEVIQKILGHSSQSITADMYGTLSIGEVHERFKESFENGK